MRAKRRLRNSSVDSFPTCVNISKVSRYPGRIGPALQQRDAFDMLFQARDEYLELLKRCPAKLRAYREREGKRAAEVALFDVPSLSVGAPRKDSRAAEAIGLRKAGLSWAKIAIELNRKYGTGTTTVGAVRQLVLYRGRRRTSGRTKR